MHLGDVGIPDVDPHYAQGQAEWRYLNDPVFHARVEIIKRTMQRATGIHLDESDSSLSTLSICFALVMDGYYRGLSS